MIFDFRHAYGDLAACQVVLKVVPQPGRSETPPQAYALRGQLYEAIESCLMRELVALVPQRPRRSAPSPFQELSLDFLRLPLDRCIEPLLAAQSLTLKEIVLRPLRCPVTEPPRLATLSGPLVLSHQWVEVTIGPVTLKDQFLLTTDVVARVLCSPIAMERGHGSLEALSRDLSQALKKLGPKMSLEDWTLAAGVRASALLEGLQHSPFARWLEKVHVRDFGVEHLARIEACWITESRIEPAAGFGGMSHAWQSLEGLHHLSPPKEA
jgi:hypothetical protein